MCWKTLPFLLQCQNYDTFQHILASKAAHSWPESQCTAALAELYVHHVKSLWLLKCPDCIMPRKSICLTLPYILELNDFHLKPKQANEHIFDVLMESTQSFIKSFQYGGLRNSMYRLHASRSVLTAQLSCFLDWFALPISSRIPSKLTRGKLTTLTLRRAKTLLSWVWS